MFILDERLIFPPVAMADEDGLLAIGGDLRRDRLLLAYKNGIFPWYGEDEPICWWSPDPRFVLFPDELKISNSMRTVLNSGRFRFTTNKAFPEVIKSCKTAPRKEQEGTWISQEMMLAYLDLHQSGYAHSAETWLNGELVGGLYGIRLGNVFFGESMFTLQANASKFAFIRYVQQLKEQGIHLIDCQVYTSHLQSLGARMVSRDTFLDILAKHSGE